MIYVLFVIIGVVLIFALIEIFCPRVWFSITRLWMHLQDAWNQNTKEMKSSEKSSNVRADASSSEPNPVVAEPPRAEAPESAAPATSPAQEEAQQLWMEARAMRHGYIPDLFHDPDYLTKVYDAARLNHLEALTKLGEYALRRHKLIEAYYWFTRAKRCGGEGLTETLRQIRLRWRAAGCPNERLNQYIEFSPEQSAFARALLELNSGINLVQARACLRALSNAGQEDAKQYWSKS